ncbi:MAG: hypothetical protein CMM46_09405 [Rhodospirillaceae bacterium]|nr:hypothetical protein [Rhodospirillaceae bacterium]
MSFVVVISNVLVHFPINDWLTWGAFTFPVAFLVTDLSNRAFGPARAAKVVFVGFVVGVLMSAVFSDWVPFEAPNILSQVAILTAVASGSAFLTGQLLDIAIFQRLRKGAWWHAPLVSSAVASAVDTLIFFYLLFWVFFPEWGLVWYQLGIGDYAVKAVMAMSLLVPYRALMATFAPQFLAGPNGAAST